jgi:hypothetical protein
LFSKRHLIIGKPYYPTVSDPTSDKIPAPEMARLTAEIMIHIGALIPAEFHGYYAAEIAAYQAQSATPPVA